MSLLELMDVSWSWFAFGAGVLVTLVILAIGTGITSCLLNRAAPEPEVLADEPEVPRAPRLGRPKVITYRPGDYEEPMWCGNDTCHRLLPPGEQVKLVPFGDDGEILFCLACAPSEVVI
jgi:hypothetical protein